MKLSLRIKIAAPIVLFIAVAGAAGAYYFIRTEREILYRELDRDRRSLSELIAAQLAIPVKLDNADRINNILNGLRKRPGILHASVWYKGSSNAVYGAEKFAFPQQWAVPSDTARSLLKDGRWLGSTPIKYNGQTLGELFVASETAEIDKRIAEQIGAIAWTMLILVLGAGGIGYFLQLMVANPIINLGKITKEITQKGDYTIRATFNRTDEIGELYQNFNAMLAQVEARNKEVQELNRSLEERIAARVREMQAAKDEAELQTARALAAQKEAEQLARELEIKQNFDSGLAAFAQIMQEKSSSNIETWGDHLLDHLIKYVGAVQGALYVTDNVVSGDIRLRLISTYAYDLKTIIKKTVKAGDGVAGEVVRNKRPMYLKQVPEGFLKITSTLGEAAPAALLIVPLIVENEVQGLLEIASFQPFTDFQIAFIEKLSQNIAYTVLIFKNNENIRKLLNETQEKNRQLTEREEQLQALNENLESLVAERTRELEQTLVNLQNTQSQLVQSEKMASLGQLIAGIAHEINTPIGAIKASAGNMNDLLPTVLDTLPGLVAELSPQERDIFYGLYRRSQSVNRSLSSKEERAIRRRLTATLEQGGVPDADDVARTLTDAGIFEVETHEIPLLIKADASRIVQTLYALCQMRLNLENIELASEKTKKIVYALKTYAHRTDSETQSRFNLHDNIDVILTLYNNQIKYGITLQTHYDENIPELMGYPDELGQVWTNIIHNALQAMNYAGELTIETALETDDEGKRFARVSITDSGPGIPPEVQERIFEPFFTTKAQGEGTGMGLDICRRIVQKHNGSLSVESVPGRTTFITRLPVE
jgi:C4-dicarboxylate-specific signal transduction histidine kinase